MKLTNLSIKRPVFMIVIFVTLMIAGILSYRGMTVNDMPNAEFPYVTVTIIEPGASADAIETRVSKNVEKAVSQISGVKHVYTIISEGISNTIIEFTMDKSPDTATQEVRDKISGVIGELPTDIQDPMIVKFNPMDSPIVSLAVTGNNANLELSNYVRDNITKKLYTIKGVGGVDVYGDLEREIQIKLDMQKMAAYSLTTSQVLGSLKSDNLEVPGGFVKDGKQEISLRTNANVKKVEDFNNILITKKNDKEIRLKDIAVVIDGIKDKESISHYEGKTAIGIDIKKQSGENTVKVADEIAKSLIEIRKELPEGVKVEMVRDNSVSIRASVEDVFRTMIEGCVMAVIIVFIFLRELEGTLISAISLPTSIITTFIAMKIMDFSLNTLSLLALSLAVGLLIDDAIVVIENIMRHVHMGKPALQAAKEGTEEIGLAVLATTFAVVAVFIPVAMVTGMIGKYFKEFGLTVAASMLVSLFVSFTIVPLMASRFLKVNHKPKNMFWRGLDRFNEKFDWISEKYSELLSFTLKHRIIPILIAFIMLISSLMLIPKLGFSFMVSTDNNEVGISMDLDSGLTLSAANEKAVDIEKIISKHREVKYAYTTLKKDSISILVMLVDKNDRDQSAQELADVFRKELSNIAGIQAVVNASSAGAGGKDVGFDVKGTNNKDIQSIAVELQKIIKADPHATDVAITYKPGKPEVTLEVDRNKAADLGVNAAAAADTVRTFYNGVVVSKYEENKDRFDVRVSANDTQNKDLSSLDSIYMNGNSNEMVPLSNVVNEIFSSSPSVINRLDRAGRIEVSANVVGMPSGDFINMIQKKIDTDLVKPAGVTVELGGQNQSMQEGFSGLLLALALGVVFIFMVMAAQFESFIDPIAIMFALPLAIIGAILGLFFSGNQLSIMALIGIILLMGLVAKNAILLIDFAKQKRAEGIERGEALILAGRTRFRPIIMTSLAMIFGMIPVTLATGSGSEMRAPMAYAVIGGLITSTLLTLIVVPIVYTYLDDMKKFSIFKLWRKIRGKKEKVKPVE